LSNILPYFGPWLSFIASISVAAVGGFVTAARPKVKPRQAGSIAESHRNPGRDSA
jgi:hypothetical protein